MVAEKEQLIDGGGHLRGEVGEYLASHHAQLSPDYAIVGVIGSQSSGKSTLLNALFDTTFGVMNAQAQRRQTTRGIWLATWSERDLVVLDIEGADSRERWQEKGSVEKKTALFGLVVANVLIINLWLTEIGRFSAANYDIIKLIFELNLLHFRRDVAKKLLFVIRDFSPEEDVDQISKFLHADLRRLWAEIRKPSGCEGLDLAAIVSIEVVTLRHYVYLREGFDADVAALRSRFDKSVPNCLLSGYTHQNVPPDALHLFLQKVWTSVSENRDVNIPQEKIVVASYRCGEIRGEVLAELESDVAAAKSRSEDPSFSLVETYRSATKRAVESYRRRTQYYDACVAEEGAKELERLIAALFQPLIEGEDSRFKKKVLEQLRSDLQALISGDFEARNTMASIAVRRNIAEQQYAQFLSGLNLDSDVRCERARLFGMQVMQIVEACANASSTTALATWRKKVVSCVDAAVQKAFSQLTLDSWRTLNAEIGASLNDFRRRGAEASRGSEEGRKAFSEDVMVAQEQELLHSILDELRRRGGLISHSLVEGFRSAFERCEDGERRSWKSFAEAEIEELFARSKRRLSSSLEFLSGASALEFDREVVFTREDAARMRESFESAASAMLEAAFNEKFSRTALQRVPLWLWVALLYFMHDNVLLWAQRPWFFFFIGFCLALVPMLYNTGVYIDLLAAFDRFTTRVHAAYTDTRYALRLRGSVGGGRRMSASREESEKRSLSEPKYE